MTPATSAGWEQPGGCTSVAWEARAGDDTFQEHHSSLIKMSFQKA